MERMENSGKEERSIERFSITGWWIALVLYRPAECALITSFD